MSKQDMTGKVVDPRGKYGYLCGRGALHEGLDYGAYVPGGVVDVDIEVITGDGAEGESVVVVVVVVEGDDCIFGTLVVLVHSSSSS